MGEIAVSIICNVFNHEKYIRDALESFVTQKTNFAFEVLIHDDASTDSTAQIIREYEEKYPEIIKPIYQTVNQYSQNVSVTRVFQIPRVKGKYIAMCEGDDYWTDPNKLQRQFDALEANPNADICAHKAFRIHADSKEILSEVAPADKDTILSTADVILGGGAYVATNSLMYRANLDSDLPEYRKKLMIDYTLQIQGSLRGGMLYLKDCMSVYRWMGSGSWTQRTAGDLSKQRAMCERTKTMLREVNEATGYLHNEAISKRLLIENLAPWNTAKENRKVLKENAGILKKLEWKTRMKMIIKVYLPGVVRLKQRITL